MIHLRKILLFCSLILLFFNSCVTENAVPAYIHVPAFSLTTKPSEGTASEKITDAWVYVDGQINGVFQLPATLPIIEIGKHDLKIFPGVRNNGTRSNPVIYALYNAYSVNFDLKAGKVDTIRPFTTYFNNLNFAIMEDFERTNTFIIDQDNNTNTRFTIDANGFEGKCASLTLNKTNPRSEKASAARVPLSEFANSIFLEMNYKTEAFLSVGIIGSSVFSTPETLYKITLVPNKTWNKTYINLTNEVKQLKLTNFQIVFGAELPDSLSTAKVLIDNVKLIEAK